MDEATADNTLRWYEDLEAQMIDLLRVIPPQGSNLGTWSPRLATIMVEACNLLESVLYHITLPTGVIKGKPVVNIKGKDKERTKLQLQDYAELYAAPLRLSERKAAVLQAPFRWISPFSGWGVSAPGSSFPAPHWWKIHNRSKHRRLDHHHEFTLDGALDALAGAMITLVTVPTLPVATPLVQAMIGHRWLDLSAEWAESIVDFYSGHVAPENWFCPETSLFAVLLGHKPVDEYIRYRGGILGGGQKLRQWLRG